MLRTFALDFGFRILTIEIEVKINKKKKEKVNNIFFNGKKKTLKS